MTVTKPFPDTPGDGGSFWDDSLVYDVFNATAGWGEGQIYNQSQMRRNRHTALFTVFLWDSQYQYFRDLSLGVSDKKVLAGKNLLSYSGWVSPW